MELTRPTAAIALAAALGCLLPACGGDGAEAAPGAPAGNVPAIVGTLTYRIAGGTAYELAQPVHGTCVAFEAAAVSIDNRTDATAHLRDGCAGPEGDVIVPDTTWEQGDGRPATAVVMLRH